MYELAPRCGAVAGACALQLVLVHAPLGAYGTRAFEERVAARARCPMMFDLELGPCSDGPTRRLGIWPERRENLVHLVELAGPLRAHQRPVATPLEVVERVEAHQASTDRIAVNVAVQSREVALFLDGLPPV